MVGHKRYRYALGLTLILLTAIIWVGASQLIQFIFRKESFEKPLFLTWFNSANFCWWLLGFGCFPKWRTMSFRHHKIADHGEQTLSEGEVVESEGETEVPKAREYSIKEVMEIALFFAPIWCCANLAFNESLAWTSVASNTILSSTSSIFVFLFSCWFLNDKFHCVKFIAVWITLGGVALVMYASEFNTATEDSKGETWYGDIMALLSAVLYASYTILLQMKITDEENFPMPMFFGFVGVIVLTTCWPLIGVFHYTGIEPFELPSPWTVGFLFINSFIGTNLSDVLWAQSVLLTSPLVATLGLSLTIPLALISDAIFDTLSQSPVYFGGAMMVTCGFLLVNLADIQCNSKLAEDPPVPASSRGNVDSINASLRGSTYPVDDDEYDQETAVP